MVPWLESMMKHLGALTLVASTLLAAAVPAHTQPSAGPEREVLALVQQSTRDWTRGDIEAFCAHYADDAVYLSPSGVTRGRQAVLERYRTRYADRAAMGNLTLDPLDTRVGPGPNPTTVSIAARWTLTYPDKPAATGLTLVVWQRTADGWRIVQDASM
jgi:uncharacterized protein (TIGR02246 family)